MERFIYFYCEILAEKTVPVKQGHIQDSHKHLRGSALQQNYNNIP